MSVIITAEPAANESRESGRSMAYIPAIDGLRAVAVMAVLLYHAGVSWMPGGFLGVDLFFVLSGYLITSLLVIEHRSAGRIDLRAFWARRARRLLPALFAVLVMTAVLTAFWADAAQFDRMRGDAMASLFYVTNWWFIAEGTSYFDALSPPPLRHMWSLAIEEQYYLMWPIIFAGLLAWVGLQRRRLALIVGVGALVSALWMAVLYTPGSDPSRVYYGTGTRAFALLIGAALAFLFAEPATLQRLRRPAAVLGYVGLAGLLVFFGTVTENDDWMYQGGLFLVALVSAAAIAHVASTTDSLLSRALSWRPLVAIGLISYGLYLYHWPLFVFVDEERTGLDGFGLFVVRMAMAFGVAVASYLLLEQPVRRRGLRGIPRRSRIPVVVAVVVGVIAIVLLSTSRFAPAYPDEQAQVGPATESQLSILLTGDSVALALGLGFVPDEFDNRVVVSNRGSAGCGTLETIQRPEVGPSRTDLEACIAVGAEVSAAVIDWMPDVVLIVAGALEVFDQEVEGEVMPFGSDSYDDLVVEQVRARIDLLAADDAEVVVLGPSCMDEKKITAPGVINHAERQDTSRVARVDDLYAEAAGQAGVTFIRLSDLTCPDYAYVDELQGIQLYSDGVHLTPEGSELVWRWLIPQLSQ